MMAKAKEFCSLQSGAPTFFGLDSKKRSKEKFHRFRKVIKMRVNVNKDSAYA